MGGGGGSLFARALCQQEMGRVGAARVSPVWNKGVAWMLRDGGWGEISGCQWSIGHELGCLE